jgi:hypothetical protein
MTSASIARSGIGNSCPDPHRRRLLDAQSLTGETGGWRGFAEPFPNRPPGMHRRTYLRMRLAAGESILLALARILPKLARRNRREVKNET